MCTYVTERATVRGSAKGPSGWFNADSRDGLLRSSLSLDRRAHTQHRLLEHRLGPSSRVAVELSEDSARELIERIEAALRSGRITTAS